VLTMTSFFGLFSGSLLLIHCWSAFLHWRLVRGLTNRRREN
jgi:hypothetical protein